MTVGQLRQQIQHLSDDMEVLGSVKVAWFISAMGAGELSDHKKSKYHKRVLALFTSGYFLRD